MATVAMFIFSLVNITWQEFGVTTVHIVVVNQFMVS